MATSKSDALVIFGVTGDLAHKMIFPALYGMVKRGTLNVPVIGVAFPKWSLERLQRRAVEEYERSYNQLPESFSSKVDPSTSARALEAMFSGEFSRSSDLFEEAFRLVETP